METFKEKAPEQGEIEEEKESENTEETPELAQTNLYTDSPSDRAINLTAGRNQDPFSTAEETHSRLFSSEDD